MSISAMVRRLQELAGLRARFPDVPIILTGVGFYAPQFTAERWERHYGASACRRKHRVKPWRARRAGREGRSSRDAAAPTAATETRGRFELRRRGAVLRALGSGLVSGEDSQVADTEQKDEHRITLGLLI